MLRIFVPAVVLYLCFDFLCEFSMVLWSNTCEPIAFCFLFSVRRLCVSIMLSHLLMCDTIAWLVLSAKLCLPHSNGLMIWCVVLNHLFLSILLHLLLDLWNKELRFLVCLHFFYASRPTCIKYVIFSRFCILCVDVISWK